MGFLNKSIVTKAFFYFIAFTAIACATTFYYYIEGTDQVPFNYFVAILGIFTVFFALVFFFEIAKPLRKILKQMKFLLAGKKYKKIFTTRVDEVGILAHFFNEVTTSFEKVSRDIKEEKRMLSELEIAAKLQRDILPQKNPKIQGLDIVAKNRPAAELGGDSFDFITVGDNHYLYVGDVTGHGVPASLIMTMVNTLIHAYAEIADDPYKMCVGVNKQLKERISSTMFMTLMLLVWNEKDKTMKYVGCGHEHLLVYRAGKGKCDVYKSGGIALGMVPDNSKLIETKEIELQRDDVIILYTDGITEGRNMAGELFGLDRLIEAVEKYAPQYKAEGIVHHIALDYSRFVEEHVQDDDVTLIGLRYKGEAAKQEEEEVATTDWNENPDEEKAKKEGK
ncbi:SpoIIE family protein phosphatase [Pseudomonadota bacterium]